MAIPVPVKLDSVKIGLFDNGEIDGDSVSLFLNDGLILQTPVTAGPNQRSSGLPMDKSSAGFNKLVLFAENVWANSRPIPP